MPHRPARYCAGWRCPVKIRPPHRYCPDHRSKYTRRRRGPTPAFRVYDSAAWRHLVAVVKQEEPMCRRCKVTPTRDVDHIVSIEDGGAPLDRANLQGLCRSCHVTKTAEDRRRRERVS